MIEEIKEALKNYNGEWKENRGVLEFSVTIHNPV